MKWDEDILWRHRCAYGRVEHSFRSLSCNNHLQFFHTFTRRQLCPILWNHMAYGISCNRSIRTITLHRAASLCMLPTRAVYNFDASGASLRASSPHGTWRIGCYYAQYSVCYYSTNCNTVAMICTTPVCFFSRTFHAEWHNYRESQEHILQIWVSRCSFVWQKPPVRCGSWRHAGGREPRRRSVVIQ